MWNVVTKGAPLPLDNVGGEDEKSLSYHGIHNRKSEKLLQEKQHSSLIIFSGYAVKDGVC